MCRVSQMQFEMHEFRLSQGGGIYLDFPVIVVFFGITNFDKCFLVAELSQH